ncbi:hypothetical protein C8A03DRAFT_39355 [Achaetomium macrosporum]|uniref:Glycosyltransferase family 32 protein n=1 Tax=Achaetomium macrosporum TaxID=79813 RepID=A0AAN7C0C0_9PEZI|nr:hypothetical protein C8A03DRAFT_39355 [Achaetomium macrosporum]
MFSSADVPNRGRWRRAATVTALVVTAVVLYAWVDLHFSLPWNPDRPSFLSFPAGPLGRACDGLGPADSNANASHSSTSAPIPNLVHYVWLVADPAVFTLSFAFFVSVYSSHLFLRPDRIYIHTDVAPAVWDRAKASESGDIWTKRLLNLPGVTPNFVETPRVTSVGAEIDTFGAKSDFLRADALRSFGGLYLDTDAIPLRDLAPLRYAGFANVVGGAVAIAPKFTGFVNTGVWLSRPHSSLAEIFYEAMHAFYNGVWAISVDILSDLAYRLHAVPGEVLILNPRAFAPTSWELEDQVRLFKPHPSTLSATAALGGAVLDDATGQPKELERTCTAALAWLRERELGAGRMESWEMDFSATYVLHAFDGDIAKIRGWDGQITLKYVLARQSNYARAVYPAVWHAVTAGVIPREETLF